MANDRITREQMLIEIAYAASRRGTCDRLHVGAVVAKDFHPVSTGYVGAPSGESHCSPKVCDKTKPCLRTIHAEANALQFAREITGKVFLLGYDLACTDAPCLNCAKEICATGIKRVFYHRDYRVTAGLDHLRSHEVEVVKVDRDIGEQHIGVVARRCWTSDDYYLVLPEFQVTNFVQGDEVIVTVEKK